MYAAPITYELDGVQYIAASVGGTSGSDYYAPTYARMLVFKVGGNGKLPPTAPYTPPVLNPPPSTATPEIIARRRPRRRPRSSRAATRCTTSTARCAMAPAPCSSGPQLPEPDADAIPAVAGRFRPGGAQGREARARHGGIDPAVLASVDRQRVDHYLSNGSAVTYVTGTRLELPDMNRWTAEAARSTTGKVEVPPDCGRFIAHEHRTATLWREGVVWQLDFTSRRAVGTRRAVDFTRRPLPLPSPFESLPTQLLAGQTCRAVTVPANGFLAGKSCLWTAFPASRYLNLPWPLHAETRLGLPGRMLQVDHVVLAERNGVLEPGLFDIPAGFSKVGPAP